MIHAEVHKYVLEIIILLKNTVKKLPIFPHLQHPHFYNPQMYNQPNIKPQYPTPSPAWLVGVSSSLTWDKLRDHSWAANAPICSCRVLTSCICPNILQQH